MAEFFSELNDKHITFIQKQKIFFVATATNESSINLSPKGMDTFCVIDKNTVAYLDLTGSGNETAAHLHQNTRLTIMMCSFEKQPLIFRMYGSGSVINQYDDNWCDWQKHFAEIPGTRQIITLNIKQVQTSCGYAVPIAEKLTQRDTLHKWAVNKGDKGITQYWQDENTVSIDNLPTHIFKEES